MDVNEFRKEFLEDVRSTATADGEGSSVAFVETMSKYLIDAEVLPDCNSAFYSGTGRRNRRLRVDGYALDDFDYTLNLIVASYVGDDVSRTVTRTETEQIFEWAVRFVDEVYNNDLQSRVEISTPAADLIDTLLINKSRIRKYRILLFTDGFLSDRIETLPIRDINAVPVELQIWDVGRLYKVCYEESGRENITVDLTEYSLNGIPCLEANAAETNEYRCFLCVIPGDILADVYDRYGAQLLEGNVRSFLSTKVAVNKKIRETLITRPEMFFAFNNGISATALDVSIVTNDSGRFITRINDFQIINGGQTTASLSNARHRDKADLSTVTVQMKLTEIRSNFDEVHELIQKISRSSNSQNKVSDADFFSTHPFHVRVEQLSRRVFAPAVGGAQHDTHWFYERARGQYLQAQMRMTRGERNKFLTQNPKIQLITKPDLAKVRNTWRCLPHIVSKGAQTNFMDFAQHLDDEWMKADDSFNEKYFQDTVALYILFKQIEKQVTHETWYEQGYRANIVTYSLALLSHLIKRQYPKSTLDLQIIWNRQSVPDVILSQMRLLTKAVLDLITSPTREVANVTQWCKREGCWTKVKDLDIKLDLGMESVLIDSTDAKSASRYARKEQHMVSGIEAQSKVVNKGADYWKTLNTFISNKNVATLLEIEALKIACQIPKRLPNSIHSQQLLGLLDKAISEGWKE